MILSIVFVGVSSAAFMEAIPALLMTTSRRANSLRMVAMSAETSSSRETSATNGWNPSECQSMSLRLQPTTRAPLERKWEARNRPIPRRAPVTSTTGRESSIFADKGQRVVRERAHGPERTRGL